MDHPDNTNPKQDLEVGEMIDIHLFDICKEKSMLQEVMELSEKNGIAMGSIIFNLLLGLEISQKLFE